MGPGRYRLDTDCRKTTAYRPQELHDGTS